MVKTVEAIEKEISDTGAIQESIEKKLRDELIDLIDSYGNRIREKEEATKLVEDLKRRNEESVKCLEHMNKVYEVHHHSY